MHAQARALASMLLGHYPGNAITEMNILALGDTLERIGLDIAPQVVERAKADLSRPPSSAQLYAIAREVRVEVAPPPPKLYLALSEGVEMPEEIQAKVHEMTDPDRKRADRDAEIAEQDAEWKRKKEAARFARKRLDFCNGTGKIPVQRDGKQFCPDCGVEIPDIIAEPLPKPDRRTSWRTGEKA
jgi:hypothetical protein